MDIMRTLTYVFDDPEWVNKIAITAIITALSIVLTPLFVGLLGWVALAGYTVELVRNVRLGVRDPLPRWDDFNRYLANGFQVATAVVVYSLPNFVLGCVSSFLTQNMNSGLIGSTLVLAFSCCLFPILLIYNLVTVPMLALGLGRYTEDPRINVFFEFSFLLETLRQHIDKVLQFWLAAIVLNIIFFILGVIIVIGWVVIAALLVPVYGMLTGRFVVSVLGGLKSKPAPPPPQPVYRR
jgi:Protein of unknown function (DUF4013)